LIYKTLIMATVFAAVLGYAGAAQAVEREAGPSQVEFGPAVVYSAAGGARGIAAGDFNGDGLPDLAVTFEFGSDIQVSINQGGGKFGPPVSYPVQGQPLGIAVGDFNGDGKLDLAVTNIYGLALGILLGNGDGTFQPAYGVQAGLDSYGVAVGDFNGDGKLDVVAVQETSGQNLSVLLGNGDGTFQLPVFYGAGKNPVAVVVADFTNDGKLDVAVADETNACSVLLGNGDGTFQAALAAKTGVQPNSLAAGDFNGDGLPDLAVLDECGTGSGCTTGGISILLSNGDGTFQTLKGLTVGNGPGWIATADLNGDGVLDLALAYGRGNVGVLLGKGNAMFGPETDYSAGSGAVPFQLAIADLNADGKPDLAVAAFDDVSVLFNNGPFPAVTLSSTYLVFPEQLVGATSAVQKVTLTNSGSAGLAISSIATALGFRVQDNCGSALGVGDSCRLSVVFKPESAGHRTSKVKITDNAAGSPQLIYLSGVGTFISVTPASLNFGNQTTGTSSQPLAFTVTNVSSQAIALYSVGVTDSVNFSDTTNSVQASHRRRVAPLT
jgi:FG-GAP-like repeat